MGSTTSVAGQQPYKTSTNIGPIINWKQTEKLNGLREYTITVPNDEFHRANVLVERDVQIPFITPINGMIRELEFNEGTETRYIILTSSGWEVVYETNGIDLNPYINPTGNLS